MIENILIWSWIRIHKFSLRKRIPKILTPLAGRLMLILSHGIVWFHRKEYDQVMARHHSRGCNLLVTEFGWRYSRDENRYIIVGGLGMISIIGRWRIAN